LSVTVCLLIAPAHLEKLLLDVRRIGGEARLSGTLLQLDSQSIFLRVAPTTAEFVDARLKLCVEWHEEEVAGSEGLHSVRQAVYKLRPMSDTLGYVLVAGMLVSIALSILTINGINRLGRRQ
jgi:hypothetical protein